MRFGLPVSLSLPLSPWRAGGGQPLPGCSGSQTAVTVPPHPPCPRSSDKCPFPASGTDPLPSYWLSQPTLTSCLSSSYPPLFTPFLRTQVPLAAPLIPPRPPGSPSVARSVLPQGGKTPAWFGILAPGIRVLYPAATFLLLLI